ncbi:MAG TPA: MBL fold metallo-hydrolase [Sedimentisphaerales bacterium]|nr:MBL fold metallo-hydrolase [Sedimentisphaerales bacterium]
MQARLRFLGAARNVTGSRHMLEVDDTKILVDCGLYQERQFVSRNWAPFDVPPASLKAVLLTHAHLDHCGLLPKLVKEGFKGRIFCTSATAEIAKIILMDAAKIQEEDAAFKKKRHKKEGREGPHGDQPLYTAGDAEKCFPLFTPVEYGNTVTIAPEVEAVFSEAGHVLGSSFINVGFSQNGDARNVLFSGDVGRKNRPIIRDPEGATDGDYILVESTYGDRVHGGREDIKAAISEVIRQTRAAGGNLIVPSFALERAQELLYFIHELQHEDAIPHVMVFLDSPMASAITRVFRHHPDLFDSAMRRLMQRHESPFEFDGLKFTESTMESKAINTIKGTVIVIAGSGMCTAGRIKHHLANNITRPESTIMFVGYQAIGTLGRRIVDGDPEVRILGTNYPVKARVVQVHGFSAHADKEELLEWLGSLRKPPRKLFVVHGEAQSAQHFGQFIHERTGWEVMVPEYRQEAILD